METVATPGTTPATAETYTKEQIENIVKERLARDREARKDESANKAAETEQKLAEAKAELATASATIEALKGTSATAEEIATKLKASHAKIVESIPADKRKFIPEQLSEVDQIAYVTKNPELFFPTVTPPNTPPPVNNQGGDGGEAKYGGYASLAEWVQKDTPGYMKAKREGKLPKF